jgi:hypothetical protein
LTLEALLGSSRAPLRHNASNRRTEGDMYLGAYFATIAACLTLSTASAEALEKSVGREWVWFTDYAYFYSDWTLNGESGCRFEAGFGIKAFGKPRGGIKPFTTYLFFTTWGIGAVHVRRIDGDEACRVWLEQGDAGAISIYSDSSVSTSASTSAEASRDIDGVDTI